MTYEDKNTWRLTTEGGIRYRHVSLDGEVTQADMRLTETILLAAEDLEAFVIESFPAPTIINNIPVFNNRAYPGDSDLLLRTERIRLENHLPSLPSDPYDADSGAPGGTYQNVLLLTIDYVREETRDGFDPRLDITSQAASQFITPGTGEAKWGTGGDPNRYPLTPSIKLIPLEQHNVTWRQMPRSYFRNNFIHSIRSRMGRTNPDTVELLHNAPPESLLLTGYDYHEEFVRSQDPTFVGPPDPDDIERFSYVTVSLKLLEKIVTPAPNSDLSFTNGQDAEIPYAGHNHQWRENDGWERYFYDGVNELYPKSDGPFDVLLGDNIEENELGA